MAIMKSLGLFVLSHSMRYRWMVFCRALVAVVGGFVIAGLSVPLLALLLPGSAAMATYIAMMLSFVVWLLVIVWAFSPFTLKRIVLGAAAIIVAMSVLVLLLD